jgi:hypothetical protein
VTRLSVPERAKLLEAVRSIVPALRLAGWLYTVIADALEEHLPELAQRTALELEEFPNRELGSGDGFTDDTAAIQAAIDAEAGSEP